MKKILGIFSCFGFELPLEERLRLISESGFKSTFIWFGQEEELVRQNQREIMPELVRKYGLLLDHVHADKEEANLVWSEEAGDQQKIKDYYEDCLIFCSKHKISHLVIHPAKSRTPPPYQKNGLEILKSLTVLAKDKNVKIALENTAANEYVDYILENIESDNIGLCYDTSHDNLYGRPAFRLAEKWSKRIFVTHISDNRGEKDDHLLPGKGIYNWDKFAKIFSNIKYRGILTLEVFPEEKEDVNPREFLALVFKKAEELYKNIYR